MKCSKKEQKYIEILRLPPIKKGMLEHPFRSIRMNLILTNMKDKDNKIYFDNMDSLCCREFDVKETLLLLHHPNPNIFYSWGVSRKANYKNIGLLLYVEARRHTGWILISLSAADLYDVHLFNLGNKSIKKQIKDLYFDQLLAAIDDEIERIDEYKI